MKKKVLLTFGSRPDCIKLAPIFSELEKSLFFDPIICTGNQRKGLLTQTLNDFKLTSDCDLNTTEANLFLKSITVSIFGEGRSIIASDSDIDILFAPTAFAKEQLLAEDMGIPIYVVGSTAIDSLQWAFDNGGLDNRIDSKPILIAAQRLTGLRDIYAAALELAEENRVIFILPPDPQARAIILGSLLNTNIEHIELPPYSNYINLVRQSYLILTDSADLQEIGPALDIPVLILGDKTEYSEGVKAGAARLVGTNQRSIVHNVKCLLNYSEKYVIMVRAKNPYGSGTAARRIVKIMEEKY